MMTEAVASITFQNLEPFQNAGEHTSTEGHREEVDHRSIIESDQLDPNQRVADGPLIEADHVVIVELDQADHNPDLQAQESTRDIHLATPLTMTAAFLFAFIMAIAHHAYYQSLIGKAVGGSHNQQKTRFLGNFFPYLVLPCLVLSIDIAYTQWLFLSLNTKKVPVKCVDAAYSGSLLSMLSPEMLRRLPVMTILALTSWALPIPTSLITPGALFINPSNVTSFTLMDVPILDIASNSMSQSTYFQVSRPAAGPESTNNSSLIFLGPRSIMSRLFTAAAAFGQILALRIPYVNSSYQIEFDGPMVQCMPANATAINAMQNVIAAQMQPQNNIQQTYVTYIAYVPDLSTPERWGNFSNRTNDPTSGSNQLWLAYQTNSTDWVFPRCNNMVYEVCQLVAASYDLTITFQNGQQEITGYPPAISNPPESIEYPVIDLSQPSDPLQLAYSAYMWELSAQLDGSIGLFNDTSAAQNTQAEYLAIKSNIENTALLGSPDLNCSFALDAIFYNDSFLQPATPQRARDIQFARGRNLSDMIQEIAFNFTVSLTSDDLLAPGVPTNVTVTNTINIYHYRSLNLLLAYGTALLVAASANVLGIIAMLRNGVTIDRKWSSIVSATTGITLLEERHWERRASQPFPQEANEKEVIIVRLVDGGFTFKLSHSGNC